MHPRQADVLQTIIDFLPSGVTLFDSNLQMIACNEQFKRLLDFPAAMFDGTLPTMYDLAIFNARRGDYGPGDPEALAQQVVERARGMQPHVYERTRPTGAVLEIRGTPLPDGSGFVTIYTDVTESKRAAKYEQFRSHTLEMLTGAEPLSDILKAIVLDVEQINPSMLCSILLVDGNGTRLGKVVAPSLPNFYNEAIDGLAVAMGVGSCGTAAFTRQRVIVADIATHPYWAPYKELAARAQLVASWSQPVFSSSGQVLGTFAIYHRETRTPAQSDIDLIEQSARLVSIAIERSLAAERIRDSEALYRLLTEDVLDVVWKTDRNFRFTYISPADKRLRGYDASEVIGHEIFEMFTEEGVAKVKEIIRQNAEIARQGINADSVGFEVQHRCKDGRLLWGEVFSMVERDASGKVIGYHGITREITARKEMEDQVRQLAFYDTLTQLPNRRLLSDRLSQAIAANKRSGRHGALMFLDLDDFKPLNDLHGHVVGDLLLTQAADRLRGCVRETDTVARFGGDEFVVMLRDIDADEAESIAQAQIVAEKIRVNLSAPYQLTVKREGEADITIEHRCTASIGVALFDDRDAGLDDILKRADAAMYRAKDAGGNLIRGLDSKLE